MITRSALDLQAAGKKERMARGIEAVLLAQYPPAERVFAVIGTDRDRLLGDDRPAVQTRIDEMDGAAADFYAVTQGLSLGVQAGE